jgi:hypothetical protein
LNSSTKDNDNNPLVSVSVATTAQFYNPTFLLAVGGREKVMLTVDTDNAILKNAKWFSANTTVANVDLLGVVIVLSAEEATFFLVADNIILQL